MNTISIIISIMMPLIVVGYIIIDLYSSKKNKSSVILNNKEIDEVLHDTNDNHGERKSKKTIIDNTDYILNTYSDSFNI